MDMQKIQARADLERMVYNYALLGKIENDTATKIVSFIRLAIGGGYPPEPQCKIIPFPAVARVEQPVSKAAAPDDEGGEDKPPFSEWLENFKDSGFDDYKRWGKKILLTLHYLGINFLEELAQKAPDKIRRRYYVGDQSLAVIRAVLEKNGFTLSNAWEAAI